MTLPRRPSAVFGLLAVALLGIGLGFASGYLIGFPHNATWLPVVAALGASFLTALAAVSVETVRQRHVARQAAIQKRHDAYYGLIVAAAHYIAIVAEFRELRRRATGLSSPFRIPDAVAFYDRFSQRTAPLREAWSRVVLVGSQDAVRAANELIETTMPAMSKATAAGATGVPMLTWLLGEKWSEEQDRAFGEAMKALGLARLDFVRVARRELREPEIDLRAGVLED